jgi:hypothetical protein
VAETRKNDVISLAVWDVPMPAVLGQTFSIKAGAKSAAGRVLAGSRVEVNDDAGTMVASGTLGETPWPGTEALYWVPLDIPARREQRVAEYAVRFVATEEHQAVATWFSVAAAAKPEHTVTVNVTEQETRAALSGVEIRLGPFHARTDASGRAKMKVCNGEYQVQLWRSAHLAPSRSISIDGDVSLELTMVHVPEEHPDARWVR